MENNNTLRTMTWDEKLASLEARYQAAIENTLKTMENNNTQSKVEGEKPGFDELIKIFDDFSIRVRQMIELHKQERDVASKLVNALCKQLDDAEAKIKELESSQSWVSVKERLPKAPSTVLVWHNTRKTVLRATLYNEAYRGKTYHWSYHDVGGTERLELHETSHWQPLPSKPENK